MRSTGRSMAVVVQPDDDHRGADDEVSRGRPSVWDAVETDVLRLPANGPWWPVAEAVVRREARLISPALAVAAAVMICVGQVAAPGAAVAIGALVGLFWYLSDGAR